ncbi:hypothetical protein SNEBB_007031 [Seison nebaliae]|nr:hypothetical protein SNEBB_007031 [Seison nebaliae]
MYHTTINLPILFCWLTMLEMTDNFMNSKNSRRHFSCVHIQPRLPIWIHQQFRMDFHICQCERMNDNRESINVNCSEQSIERFTLSKSFFAIIVNGELRLFRHSNINSIDLSSTKLTSLQQSAFSYGVNLQEIIVKNTSLKFVSKLTFQRLSLKSLKLTNNVHWKRIFSTTFTHLSYMSSLDLSGNGLTSIPSNTFAHSMNIRHLTIDKNPIELISSSAFAHLRLIENLNLNHLNLLRKMEKDSFISLTDVKFLHIDFSGKFFKKIESFTFRGLSNVRTITLSYGSIEWIDSFAFDNCFGLYFIHMNNQKIERIESDAFRLVPQLKYVDLRNNQIKTIRLLQIYQSFIYTSTLNNITMPLVQPSSSFYEIDGRNGTRIIINLEGNNNLSICQTASEAWTKHFFCEDKCQFDSERRTSKQKRTISPINHEEIKNLYQFHSHKQRRQYRHVIDERSSPRNQFGKEHNRRMYILLPHRCQMSGINKMINFNMSQHSRQPPNEKGEELEKFNDHNPLQRYNSTHAIFQCRCKNFRHQIIIPLETSSTHHHHHHRIILINYFLIYLATISLTH